MFQAARHGFEKKRSRNMRQIIDERLLTSRRDDGCEIARPIRAQSIRHNLYSNSGVALFMNKQVLLANRSSLWPTKEEELHTMAL